MEFLATARGAPIPLKWTPSPNFSSRGGADISLLVFHDCEGSYEGSINWFAQRVSQVSAHFVLKEDGSEATQMVSLSDKAWHACNANPASVGIEAAGFAAKGLGAPELVSLANMGAWIMHACDIPCQEATAANGWTGFTEHAKLGAWGGGHHDFTEDPKVWAAFVEQVKAAYAKGPVPGGPSIPTPPPPAPPGFQPNPAPRSDETARIAALALKSAVIGFQRAAGLDADGDPGPATRAAYLKAVAA